MSPCRSRIATAAIVSVGASRGQSHSRADPTIASTTLRSMPRGERDPGHCRSQVDPGVRLPSRAPRQGRGGSSSCLVPRIAPTCIEAFRTTSATHGRQLGGGLRVGTGGRATGTKGYIAVDVCDLVR